MASFTDSVCSSLHRAEVFFDLQRGQFYLFFQASSEIFSSPLQPPHFPPLARLPLTVQTRTVASHIKGNQMVVSNLSSSRADVVREGELNFGIERFICSDCLNVSIAILHSLKDVVPRPKLELYI